MSIISQMWGRVTGSIRTQTVADAFGVQIIESPAMNRAINDWNNIVTGSPPWIDHEDDVESINAALLVSDVRSSLALLDVGIAVSGSPRADWLQGRAEVLIKRLREQLPHAYALGGMMIKFNGASWDLLMPNEFYITKTDDDGNILECIFREIETYKGSKYVRLEYHHYDGDIYVVTNKAFKLSEASKNNYELQRPIKLQSIPAWEDFSDEVRLENVEHTLFSYWRIPGANPIEKNSPLGASCFVKGIKELKAIDIAFSRKAAEVEDSKHITFIGQAASKNAEKDTRRHNKPSLPRFVRGLGIGLSDSETKSVHEHVPTMLTEQRIRDINFDLSLLGVKCGFSPGMFVMDGQTGVLTATQVEADDRDTIQTIKGDRDALQYAIDIALYGADTLATVMNIVPNGVYEVEYSFGDITYSYEEDKASWKSYAQQNWIPLWLYFVKFEKMSEDEAKQYIEEAKAGTEEKGLFGDEE